MPEIIEMKSPALGGILTETITGLGNNPLLPEADVSPTVSSEYELDSGPVEYAIQNVSTFP